MSGWRPDNWNEIAEGEIKRLSNPLPQSSRTYLEAGATAMLKALNDELRRGNEKENPKE